MGEMYDPLASPQSMFTKDTCDREDLGTSLLDTPRIDERCGFGN